MAVVYGKGCVAAMGACRAVWALMYAGVKDVRLLDGGFAAWQRSGAAVAAGPEKPVPIARFSEAGESCVRKEFLASTQEVSAISRRQTPGALVDVRKIGEYEGWFRCVPFAVAAAVCWSPSPLPVLASDR